MGGAWESIYENSGSLKDLTKVYKISYPTVHNRLDELIKKSLY